MTANTSIRYIEMYLTTSTARAMLSAVFCPLDKQAVEATDRFRVYLKQRGLRMEHAGQGFRVVTEEVYYDMRPNAPYAFVHNGHCDITAAKRVLHGANYRIELLEGDEDVDDPSENFAIRGEAESPALPH